MTLSTGKSQINIFLVSLVTGQLGVVLSNIQLGPHLCVYIQSIYYIRMLEMAHGMMIKSCLRRLIRVGTGEILSRQHYEFRTWAHWIVRKSPMKNVR